MTKEESQEISIYAISGYSNISAMRLLGTIGDYSVKIPVDSRSNSNLLDSLVVRGSQDESAK